MTARLREKVDLNTPDLAAAAAALASPEVPESDKADFLVALADKGESAAEVAGLAQAFRGMAVDPGVRPMAGQAIDIVGTGGDHSGGFNISSLVVLTLASLGVPVMKHGNRGITSKCGSADLFSAWGFELQAPPEKLQQALSQLGYVFFFAPSFHPAFKHIVPVRKQLAAAGRRTVFNILGPLINPGQPAHVLLGVFSETWVPLLAGAMDTLGVSAGLAVHGVIGPDRGIDELTTATANRVQGSGRLNAVSGTWQAADFGLPRAEFSEIQGGDLEANLAKVEAVLAGQGPSGLVDTVVLNTATALWICGRVGQVTEGLTPAREALLGGAVRRKLAATREFFAGNQ